MLTLHYTITERDIVFPERGRPEVRIRELPDCTVQVTNIAAGSKRVVANMDRAIEMAQRILRIARAGGRD